MTLVCNQYAYAIFATWCIREDDSCCAHAGGEDGCRGTVGTKLLLSRSCTVAYLRGYVQPRVPLDSFYTAYMHYVSIDLSMSMNRILSKFYTPLAIYMIPVTMPFPLLAELLRLP